MNYFYQSVNQNFLNIKKFEFQDFPLDRLIDNLDYYS